jgi:hypothetical protein
VPRAVDETFNSGDFEGHSRSKLWKQHEKHL